MTNDVPPLITTFNAFDIGVVIFVGLSTLLGLARGFTREVLGIGAWVVAALVTLYVFPVAKPYAHQFIDNPYFANISAILFLFIITYITCSYFIQNITATVRKSILNGLDRSLGLLFGTARASAVLISLFFLSGLLWKTPEARPLIIQTSKSFPFILRGAKIVVHCLPEDYQASAYVQTLIQTTEYSSQEIMFKLANPTVKDIDSRSDKVFTYKSDQRRDMNRLFQNHAEQ